MAEGVTDPVRLVIYGASAGGLLIGATLNTAPKRKDGRPFFAGMVCASAIELGWLASGQPCAFASSPSVPRRCHCQRALCRLPHDHA